MTIQKEISIKIFIYLLILYALSFFLFGVYPHIIVAIYGLFLLKKKDILAIQTILLFLIAFHISIFLALFFSSGYVQFYILPFVLNVIIFFVLIPIKNHFLKLVK